VLFDCTVFTISPFGRQLAIECHARNELAKRLNARCQ
jgi:hypothetical protein